MNTILLIIALQVAVILLSGCSTLQNKMDELNGCEVPPIHTTCEPNESLLICDSEERINCQGGIVE